MSGIEDSDRSRDHPGWKECRRHGKYRADEQMCPDCSDNLARMNDNKVGVYPSLHTGSGQEAGQ